jgi:hypothetical protein
MTWGMGSLNLAQPTMATAPLVPVAANLPVSTIVAGKLVNLEESIKNIEAQLVAE